jgi:hypothetical protein
MNMFGKLTVTLAVEVPGACDQVKYKKVPLFTLWCDHSECHEKVRIFKDMNPALCESQRTRLSAEFVAVDAINI